MATSFSFSNYLAGQQKNKDLYVWEGKTFKNKETVKLTFNEKDSSVALEVIPKDLKTSLFGKRSTLAERKIIHFTNIGKEIFLEETKKLEELIKRADDIERLVRLIKADFEPVINASPIPSPDPSPKAPSSILSPVVPVSENIQALQKEAAQQFIAELKQRVADFTNHLEELPEHIRTVGNEGLASWQVDLESIETVEGVKLKEEALDKIIHNIAELCKSDKFIIINESHAFLDTELQIEFADPGMSEERASAINNLRTIAFIQRKEVWDGLRNKADEIGDDLKAIAEWIRKVDLEKHKDEILNDVMSNVQKEGTSFLSAVTSILPKLMQLFTGASPFYLEMIDTFEGVIQECINKSLALDHDDSKEVAEIFVFCRNQFCLNVADHIANDHPQSTDTTTTHPAISNRAYRELNEFRAKSQTSQAENYEDLPAEWAGHKKDAAAMLKNLGVLETLSGIYKHYNSELEAIEKIVKKMTGPEKVHGERILKDLRDALDPGSKLENSKLYPQIAKAYENNLREILNALNTQAVVESQKRTLREEIDMHLDAFDKYIEDCTSKIEDIENAFSIKLTKPREELEKKRAEMASWKERGTLPFTYQHSFIPQASIPYTESVRSFLSTNFIGARLPTSLNEGVALAWTTGIPTGLLAGAAALAAPWVWRAASASSTLDECSPWENPAIWNTSLYAGGGLAAIVPMGMALINAVAPAAISKSVALEDLPLEDLPAYQSRVQAEIEIQMNHLERSTGINKTHAMYIDYLDKKDQAQMLSNQLNKAPAVEKNQHYNAWQISKRLTALQKKQKEKLNGDNLTTHQVYRQLRADAAAISALIDESENNTQALVEQIKKFHKEAAGLKSTYEKLNKNVPLNAQAKAKLEQAKNEYEAVENLLIKAKQSLIHSLEEKTAAHQREVNKLLYPLQTFPAIHAKVTSMLGSSRTKAANQVLEKPLRAHLTSLLSTSFHLRTPIDHKVLKQLSPEALSNYKKSVEAMIGTNAAHITLFSEAATKAQRSEKNYQQAKREAIEQCDELDRSNQLYAKAKLEAQIRKLEEEMQDLHEKSVSGPWISIPYWSDNKQSIFKALEIHARTFGKANTKLTSAAKEAETHYHSRLSIPEQIEFLERETFDNVGTVIETLGERFQKNTSYEIESHKELISSYSTALEDVIGRFYIPENNKLRKEIESTIKVCQKALDNLQNQYRNSYFIIDVLFGWTGITKTAINKLKPDDMRTYQKEIARVKQALNVLEEKFSIKSILSKHSEFEDDIQEAKIQANEWRNKGKHLYAHQLDSKVEEIVNTRAAECNLKVKSAADLKSLHRKLGNYILNLNKEVAKCKNLVENERRLGTSLSYEKQYSEILKMNDTDLRESSIESLRNGAVQAIKTSLKNHKDTLDSFREKIEEINEEFRLPSKWMNELSAAVEREQRLHSENRQTFPGGYLFGLTLERLNAKQAAEAATRVTEIFDASLKNIYQPPGLKGVNLKALGDIYTKYQEAKTGLDAIKTKLLTHKQFLYLHNMDDAVDKAANELKDLDGTINIDADITKLIKALDEATQKIRRAARIASTSPHLSLGQQAEKMDPHSVHASQLCQYVAEDLKKTNNEKKAEIKVYEESIDKVSIELALPLSWTNAVHDLLNKSKHKFDEFAKGIVVQERGYTGISQHIKSLDNISLLEVSSVEKNLNDISSEFSNNIHVYNLSTLKTQFEYYDKLLQEAYEKQASYTSSEQSEKAQKVDALITKVKTDLSAGIDTTLTNIPAAMSNITAALRTQTTELLKGMEKIKKDPITSFASRLRLMDVGSSDYNKCKEQLKKFARKELNLLKEHLDKYEKRLDTIQIALQKLAGASLPADWMTQARVRIQEKVNTLDALRDGLELSYKNTKEYTPFDQLDIEQLNLYEQLVLQMMGSQLSTAEKKNDGPVIHAPYSTMRSLEVVLELELIDRELRGLDSAFTTLTKNIDTARRNNETLKMLSLEAIEASAKKLLARSVESMDSSFAAASLIDIIRMSHASMLRADNECRRSVPITIDPWATILHFENRNTTEAARDLARAQIAEMGIEIDPNPPETRANAPNMPHKYKGASLESLVRNAVATLTKEQTELRKTLADITQASGGVLPNQPFCQDANSYANILIPAAIASIEATIERRGITEPLETTAYADLLALRINIVNTIARSLGPVVELRELQNQQDNLFKRVHTGGAVPPPAAANLA